MGNEAKVLPPLKAPAPVKFDLNRLVPTSRWSLQVFLDLTAVKTRAVRDIDSQFERGCFSASDSTARTRRKVRCVVMARTSLRST